VARTYGEPPETSDRLIDFADASMYAAKEKGKNRLEHQCS
jgi:GGDEF domain-containing protein